MRTVVAFAVLFVATAAFAQPVSVISLFPERGSVAGGDVLLMHISNLPMCDPGPCQYNVTFDGIVAQSTEDLGLDTIRVITPPHPSGNAVVALRNGNTVIATVPWQFRFAGPGEAASPDPFNYELVLVPLAVGSESPVPGAFGSRWTTELWVSNSGDRDIEFFLGYPQCFDLCPRIFPALPAHSSEQITLSNAGDPTSAGYLFYVQRGGAEFVHFSLRARDISRTSENAGTEIPVFRWSFETISKATLLNVPLEPASRTSLRIYGDGAQPATIRIYSLPADTLLGAIDVPVAPADLKPYGETHGFPARSEYAQIGDLRTAFPSLANGKYRIEVTSTGGWVWALATVTNNDTQLITAIDSTPAGRYGVLRR